MSESRENGVSLAHRQSVDELIAAGQWIASRQWCPATGGNFSQRVSDQQILMTASGCDKGQLTTEDLLLIHLSGARMDAALNANSIALKPSAEMPLHVALYQLDPRIGAVLHTHSVAATVLSRVTLGDALVLQGYEMQKALRGVHSHILPVRLAMVDNDQDMQQLVQQVTKLWRVAPLQWGLLVRGHGLYAWGGDMTEARRHLEGIEFLLACELALRSCR
jgi:methylthioribulose-1-phosphate dehydratase